MRHTKYSRKGDLLQCLADELLLVVLLNNPNAFQFSLVFLAAFECGQL